MFLADIIQYFFKYYSVIITFTVLPTKILLAKGKFLSWV